MEIQLRLIECLPIMQKALSSAPSTTQTRYGGAHLQSQHPGGEGRRTGSSELSLATICLITDGVRKNCSQGLEVSSVVFKDGFLGPGTVETDGCCNYGMVLVKNPVHRLSEWLRAPQMQPLSPQSSQGWDFPCVWTCCCGLPRFQKGEKLN